MSTERARGRRASSVGYGQSEVIRGLSLDGQATNEIVAVMGRNGMGKTTLIKALIGLLPVRSGHHRARRAGPDRQGALTSGWPRGWPTCRRAA